MCVVLFVIKDLFTFTNQKQPAKKKPAASPSISLIKVVLKRYFSPLNQCQISMKRIKFVLAERKAAYDMAMGETVRIENETRRISKYKSRRAERISGLEEGGEGDVVEKKRVGK